MVQVAYVLDGARVTHVVAANLPAAKIKEFKKQKHPPPVLTPAWIVDSAAKGSRWLPDAVSSLAVFVLRATASDCRVPAG